MTKRYYRFTEALQTGGSPVVCTRRATLEALSTRPHLQPIMDDWLDLYEDEALSDLDGFTRKDFKPVFGARSISI